VKQFTGSARERWGKLHNDDWETIAGKKDSWSGEFRAVRSGESGGREAGRRMSRALTDSGAKATPPAAFRIILRGEKDEPANVVRLFIAVCLCVTGLAETLSHGAGAAIVA